MEKLITTAAIIDALGGSTAVAQLTGALPTAVANWKAAGVFPSNTFILIKSELLRHGCTAPDELWSMRGHPSVKRKA